MLLPVDVGGVGYEVAVPLSTFYGLSDADGDVTLRIHTHVREDALMLYGFATALEQELFERLIGVSGIGPKVALGVLSGIEPHELIRAIERGFVKVDRHCKISFGGFGIAVLAQLDLPGRNHPVATGDHA